MTQLSDTIETIDGWGTKSPAQLLSALTEITHPKKREAERVWSIAGIAKEFGTTVAETIYGGIAGAGMTGIAARFAATGLDATDPQWLAVADALIAGPLASLSAETQQALKWIGHSTVQLWADPLSEAEVSAAKAELVGRDRMVNATGFFAERMTEGGDAAAVWAQAWVDAETPSP